MLVRLLWSATNLSVCCIKKALCMMSLFCFLKEFNFSIFSFQCQNKRLPQLDTMVPSFCCTCLDCQTVASNLGLLWYFCIGIGGTKHTQTSNLGMDLVGWFRNYSAIRLPSYENFQGNEYPNLHGSCVPVWTFAHWLVHDILFFGLARLLLWTPV